MSSVEQLTIIFLGPQGCGKGTHVDLLADYLKKTDSREITYFSAGKLLRKFADTNNYTASLIKPIMAQGQLLPLFLTVGVFAEDIAANMSHDTHLFIDGFPRMVEQVPILDSALSFYNRVNPTVITINISDEEAVRRLLHRHRADDTAEGIQKRLAWTREQSKPIAAWFKGNSKYKTIEIDGERTIEEVQQSIREELGLV